MFGPAAACGCVGLIRGGIGELAAPPCRLLVCRTPLSVLRMDVLMTVEWLIPGGAVAVADAGVAADAVVVGVGTVLSR